ncbi:MAG: hypothetical protein NY202_03045 [Mollicutes bacterium UO1]
MTSNAQEYLNKNFADKNSTKIILDLYYSASRGLFGDLTLQDYPNLEEISLADQELTSLAIINCPHLKSLNVRQNKLTKLELAQVQIDQLGQPTANQISEIIAGQNELTRLTLTTCSQLKKLMVPDNPLLTEIKGLNWAAIKQLNITNTLVNLATDFEQLQAENKRLYQALRRVDEAGIEKKLILTEAIQTAKQAEEAIKRHLKKTEQE